MKIITQVCMHVWVFAELHTYAYYKKIKKEKK